MDTASTTHRDDDESGAVRVVVYTRNPWPVADDLRATIAERGWRLVAGENPPLSLRAVRAAAAAGSFDVLMVPTCTVISRNVGRMLRFVRDLADIGVRFVAIDEDIDTTTPHGRLMVDMLAAVIEFEAKFNSRDDEPRAAELARDADATTGGE